MLLFDIYNVKYTGLNSNRINIFDNNEKIKNPPNINDEFPNERQTSNIKNEIDKQRKEQKAKELEILLEELKEKQRKEQKEKELEKLLEELKEKQRKEQQAKKKKESNIKDETNLLFD